MKRTLATLAVIPMSVFVAHPAVALAAGAASCAGQRATIVVTSHSPHLVRGTAHRDVIVIKAAGHVVSAGAGNDLICGSAGADTIDAGAGNDRVLAGAGDTHRKCLARMCECRSPLGLIDLDTLIAPK